MPRKQLTNVQAVTQMMDFSRYGALAQVFIVDAIEKQAKRVAAIPLDELRAQFGTNAFISAEAWQGVAVELRAKLDAHLGGEG